jgi:hypothetical protein
MFLSDRYRLLESNRRSAMHPGVQDTIPDGTLKGETQGATPGGMGDTGRHPPGHDATYG